MEANRKFVTTNPHGTVSGAVFDDRVIIRNIAEATICRIIVRYSTIIDALTVHYRGQTETAQHGGFNGTVAEVILEPDELITHIQGASHTDGYYITKLAFTSNKGRKWGPYGSNPGRKRFNWNAITMISVEMAPVMGLLYFSGAGTTEINQLQATFAQFSVPIGKPPSIVRYEYPSTGPSTEVSNAVSQFARSLMSPVVTLTVGNEGTEFHAYEDILCRLPFFRAALQHGFKETCSKTIKMPEDEPEIISALLEFLYVGTYTYTCVAIAEGAEAKKSAPSDIREGSFHLRLYAAAFKYDCKPLADAAKGSLIYVLQQLDGIAVLDLIKETYDRGCDAVVSDGSEDVTALKRKLPKIIRGVYVTHGEEMKNIVFECPALANDLLRLSVAED